MPELPEVETVMRGLSAKLLGRRLTHVAVNRADMRWPFPAGLAQTMTGARVTSFRRRGKYILMRLEGGNSVLLHLGMSGRMVLSPARPNRPPLHEHLVLETDEGWHLGFVDPRRFGAIDLVPTADEDNHRLLAGLGPEPLEDGVHGGRPGRGELARSSHAAEGGAAGPEESSPAWATSMSARRCSAPGSVRGRLAHTVPARAAAAAGADDPAKR